MSSPTGPKDIERKIRLKEYLEKPVYIKIDCYKHRFGRDIFPLYTV